MTLGAVPPSVPCDGCVTTVNVNGSFSGSVPVRVMALAVLSSANIKPDCGVAVGAIGSGEESLRHRTDLPSAR